MTALESVYAVVVLLYFFESLLFVRSDQLVLRESWQGSWSIVPNGFELAGINRRVVLGPLLPARGAVVISYPESAAMLGAEESAHSHREDVEKQLIGLRQALEPIELLSNTLTGFLFVGFPLEIRLLGVEAVWPIILGQLITLMALNGILVSVSSRRLLGRPVQTGDIAAMALSPFAAIRAPRLIWREFFAESSPAALLSLTWKKDASA